MKLKQHWKNPPPITHWTPSNTNHCSWPEITCTRNSITRLYLNNTSISQTVPSFICDLKNLTLLDLNYNDISGEFPRVLYSCSKLEYLDLSKNYFVGPIPDDIDSLSQLRHLSLGSNNFSLDIPASVGNLTELRVLQLYRNQFNGSFPPEIGSLHNLEILELAYNTKFVPSKLPSNFSQLRNLKTLWMTESNLIGEIPESIGNMTALEWLDISQNRLSGKIPSGVFMLKNLRILYLYRNMLSGQIPQFVNDSFTQWFYWENSCGLWTASNLSHVQIGDNKFTGELPDKMSRNSPFLRSAHMFSGKIPAGVRAYGKRENRLNTTSDMKMTKFQDLNFTENDILTKVKKKTDWKWWFWRSVPCSCNSSGDVVAPGSLATSKNQSSIPSALPQCIILPGLPKDTDCSGGAQDLLHASLLLPAHRPRDVKSSNILLDSEFNSKIEIWSS
ncbi:receptor-like protein 52 [Pistacia vera]|uniref:receptor-like protein 52 n=1 Tax=Pistacia vera TaxID=55513 RepID=UPI00126337B6|nr:receptor-like protein 52 [Pistacia vera]